MSSTSTRAPKRPPAKRPPAKRAAPSRSAPAKRATASVRDDRTAPAPRAPMDDRIRQRRREVRRAGARRRRRVLLSVVVLAIVGAGGFAISRSPLFAITAVRVEGVPDDRRQEVLDAAQIAKGQNLLEADFDDAVARTQALPWIRKATIRREPPSTVVVDVAPRRPAAIILTADGGWLVDLGGVVISPATQGSLPRIEVGAGVVPVPGATVEDPAARNALSLLDVLPKDMRKATRRVQAVGAGTVRLWLDLADLKDPAGYSNGHRVWVRMGGAADVDEQVTVLRALLGQLRQKPKTPPPSEIDVRVPSNPVVIP